MKNFVSVPSRPTTHYGHIVYDGQYTDRDGRVCNVIRLSQRSYMYINMNRLEREIHAQHGRPPVNERDPIIPSDDGKCWKRDENGKVHVIRVPKTKAPAHVAQIRGTNHSRGTRGKRH
jgi:hypothetical protein